MKTNLTFAAVLAVSASLLGGCASVSSRDLQTMQGTWVGHDLGDREIECRMTIKGTSLKFTSARQNDWNNYEWYNCRFTLDPTAHPKRADIFVEDCSAPQFNRKTAKAIYRIEGTTLTIASKEPGADSLPAGFDAGGDARVVVFNRQ